MTTPVTHLSMRAWAVLALQYPHECFVSLDIPAGTRVCDGLSRSEMSLGHGLITSDDPDSALITCPECAVIADQARSHSDLLEEE